MIQLSKPFLGKEEVHAVSQVVKSGNIVQGKKTAEFEKKIADYCGVKYSIAFNSGTAAIHSALFSIGVKRGDEIVTTPFTFIGTASPILMLGAKPVFADVCLDTFNINPEDVKRKLTKKTKAVVPVDLFGQTCDYEALEVIAKKHKVSIIEDACQAIGANSGNKSAGAFGRAAAFSFYATKNMTSGEGGMVTTDSIEIAKKCRLFRNHGQKTGKNYDYLFLGYNYRMTDVNAAIALEQLKKIDSLNKKRIDNAKRISEELREIEEITLPIIKKGNKSVFHQYTIRVGNSHRDKLREFLLSRGVDSRVYYPKPLHLYSVFKKYGYKKGDFPIAEKLSREVLSLPVRPDLTDREIMRITKEVKNYFK